MQEGYEIISKEDKDVLILCGFSKYTLHNHLTHWPLGVEMQI